MPITFGSVGDIISVSLVVKDLLIALNDSRGSSAEYQAVIRELYVLDTALLQVEQLSRSHAATPELQALYETAKQTAAKCQDSVASFKARLGKYNGSLTTGGSGNILKDTARKIQWRASQKDAEIAKFRAELTGYSDSINMLLATGMVKLLSTNNNNLKDQLAENGRRTHAALDQHTHVLQEVRIRLDDNRQLIESGNSLVSRMMDRLEWIQKLGSELKRFMSNVIAGNVAIYREVVALRTAFSKHVDRPLLEDPFILEDAIGRVAPVHLRFINSWAAFHAVMEIRFQGKQGLRKILKKEYVLQESATGREVDFKLDFEDAFMPGQSITMSLVFKRTSAEPSTSNSAHCPRCKAVSEQRQDADVLCSSCNMWFRRITEIHEVDLPKIPSWKSKCSFGKPSFERVEFGPSPLKRKLEEVDGEDGDYSRFRRIRVISENRRLKAPKTFAGAHKTHGFQKADENNTIRLFSLNVPTDAPDKESRAASSTFNFQGLVEEDTLKDARLKPRMPDALHALYNEPRKRQFGRELLKASRRGEEHTVKRLLTQMPDLNKEGWPYGAAFLAAIRKGHTQIVELLLAHGANVNEIGGRSDGLTALQTALILGHDQIVELLLDYGADINAKGLKSGSALHTAIDMGHERIVILLLNHGADANARTIRNNGKTALMAASEKGYDTIVKLLLEKGASINARGGSFSESTALQIASGKGHVEVVKVLLNHGVDVHNEGRPVSAFLSAIKSSHREIVSLLLHHGADFNAQDQGGDCLQAASSRGDEETVKLLLHYGADVNARGGLHGSALQAASYSGHWRIVKLLLDSGAHIDARNGVDAHALTVASHRGHERIVELLIALGADVNLQGSQHGNALATASRAGHERIVKLLIDNGANVNMKGGLQGHALGAAAYRGHERVVELLLDKGADINAPVRHRGSALGLAVIMRHDGVVQLLLDRGADVNAQTPEIKKYIQEVVSKKG